VTVDTTDCLVYTNKRKPGLLMKGCHIRDDPGLGSVTFFTILSQCLLVNVGVTLKTASSAILKGQFHMTFPAIYELMLTKQFEFGLVVTKLNFRCIHLPILRCMALRTIDFQTTTVWRGLTLNIQCNHQND